MYFVPPSRSQVTRTSVGKSTAPPSKFSGFVQSSAANCAFISALTPTTGVAAESLAAGTPGPDARTCRKRSSAVCPTSSTRSRLELPGNETIICWLVPLP